MRKMQDYIVQSKEVFVGLEDSKKTWKVAVRCEDLVIHQASMPADYKALIGYLRNNYPKCQIKVMYEAGFHGFWLHDLLKKDGIECVVVPPHTVMEEKTNRVKTDKIDALRLAHNLEKNDYKSCYVPDKERREDRQLSRTLEDVQGDIVRARNRIWKMFDFHGIDPKIDKVKPGKNDIRKLRKLAIENPVLESLVVYIDLLELLWQKQKLLRDALRALTKKKAIVAAARKMAGRLLHCVLTNQQYVVGLVSEN